MAKLNVEEMKILCGILLDHVKDWGIKEISFDANDDLYFKICHQDREFTEEFLDKPKYVIGSLSEDIEDLRRLLKDKEEVISIDLERIGAIFTALGATFYDKAGL